MLNVFEHGSDRWNRSEERNENPEKESQKESLQVECKGNGKMEKRGKNAKKEGVESLHVRGRGGRNKEDDATDQHGEESVLEDLCQNDRSMWDDLSVRTQPFLVYLPCAVWFDSRSFDYGSATETS